MTQRRVTILPGSRVSMPLYGQVLGVLRQRIVDGVYGPGDQIEPEDRLAAEFGVSRATVRQAIGELVRQGLVDRRQGRGTFVLPAGDQHPYGQRFSGSLSDLIAETTRSKAIDTVVEREADIPPGIAQALELEPAVATIVRRTRAIENRVFAYTVNYIPERFSRLISEADLRASGLMTLLGKKGVQLGSAQQLIRAELADIEISEHLEVDFAAPLLYVERLVFAVDESPVQFVKSWYRADLYEYRVTLRADGSRDKVRYHVT